MKQNSKTKIKSNTSTRTRIHNSQFNLIWNIFYSLILLLLFFSYNLFSQKKYTIKKQPKVYIYIYANQQKNASYIVYIYIYIKLMFFDNDEKNSCHFKIKLHSCSLWKIYMCALGKVNVILSQTYNELNWFKKWFNLFKLYFMKIKSRL